MYFRKTDYFSDQFLENLKTSNIEALEKDLEEHPTGLITPNIIEIAASSSLESFKFVVEKLRYNPTGIDKVGEIVVETGDLDRLKYLISVWSSWRPTEKSMHFVMTKPLPATIDFFIQRHERVFTNFLRNNRVYQTPKNLHLYEIADKPPVYY